MGEKSNLLINISETSGANSFAPNTPKTMAAREVSSLIKPLNRPKIKPKTMGIRRNKSNEFIDENLCDKDKEN